MEKQQKSLLATKEDFECVVMSKYKIIVYLCEYEQNKRTCLS